MSTPTLNAIPDGRYSGVVIVLSVLSTKTFKSESAKNSKFTVNDVCVAPSDTAYDTLGVLFETDIVMLYPNLPAIPRLMSFTKSFINHNLAPGKLLINSFAPSP